MELLLRSSVSFVFFFSIFFVTLAFGSVIEGEEFSEELLLKPLPDRKVLAHFIFDSRAPPTNTYGRRHHLFPKAIYQLVQNFRIHEMELSFTQGRWNYMSHPSKTSSAIRDITRREKREEEQKVETEREKVQRRRKVRLPQENLEAIKPCTSVVQEKVAECMSECLRTLKRNYKGRVGSLEGGIEFLEFCGFERIERDGDEFLFLPQDKVDMTVLNSAGSVLKSAITNPYFGLFSKE